MTTRELTLRAVRLRREIVDLIYGSKSGHIGGALSSADIVTALFYSVMRFRPEEPDWPERDRFILSKGHCCEGYLCALADLGFFPKAELSTFCKAGTRLIGHPNNAVPGVEMCTGSLGHGLSIAAGMAMAAKLDRKDWRVFVLMGDGEQDEGSIWEAAMFSAAHKLDNLYAILDRNHLQISGPTEDVMRLEPLREKYEAFGFHVEAVDGNDMQAVLDGFDRLSRITGKPKLLLCDTLKGKGVSYMEGRTEWHEGAPKTEEQYRQALEDLARIEKEVEQACVE